ncbi:DUF72 domain-containing protein [Paenibacillus xylaniclasticus]|uniref:DUF72 domain-containing protein n=1 Tax=Paenibacillus xylaniclasticus TaxID=588083 RepID=UPI000FDA0A3B|nr:MULTISPECIES: DUF72 domain-containing protein [Paenibacillus]GFN32749.1 hypothetical protein PCURB6_30090 [Paenibacillus curdlanolyticus]
MITIGLAGWGDQEKLYRTAEANRNKLAAYGRLFKTVEVDSSFYAVQPVRNMVKWAAETPDDFSFVVKAYQGMTGHTRGRIPYPDEAAMFRAFRESLQPVLEAGKLAAALFQYPPWFDCTRENVRNLREARARMANIPCMLEFRHQSWFEPDMRERTLAFMRSEGWIHSVCDEPQAGPGSVPIVEAVTDRKLALVRLHGRNAEGWHSSGQPNWRDVRYLYRYSEEELADWVQRLRRLEQMTEQVIVIFNNNSGGDAPDNARQLMAMLGQEVPPIPAPEAPPVEQLCLFEDELPGG